MYLPHVVKGLYFWHRPLWLQGCVTLAVLLQQNQLLSHSRRKIKVKYEAEIRSSQSLSDRLLSEKSRSMRLEKEADDTRRLYTQREMDFLRMKVEKEAAEGKVAKSERMESSRALELSKMKSEVEDSKVIQNLNHYRSGCQQCFSRCFKACAMVLRLLRFTESHGEDVRGVRGPQSQAG